MGSRHAANIQLPLTIAAATYTDESSEKAPHSFSRALSHYYSVKNSSRADIAWRRIDTSLIHSNGKVMDTVR